MGLLYDKEVERRDTYSFQINSGGELSVKETGVVTIYFKNGVFERAAFPMTAPYTRNGWRILAAMEEQIETITDTYTEGG